MSTIETSRVERRPLWWRIGHEALLLGALWMVYTLGRALAGRHVGSAYGHASQVWGLERDLRLPDEARVQGWAVTHPGLIQLANRVLQVRALGRAGRGRGLAADRPARPLPVVPPGAGAHHRARPGRALRYPLMPPRMRPDFGLVDTGVQFGQSVYGPNYANHGLVNQYAAMPSMHVGWAVLFAVTVDRWWPARPGAGWR